MGAPTWKIHSHSALYVVHEWFEILESGHLRKAFDSVPHHLATAGLDPHITSWKHRYTWKQHVVVGGDSSPNTPILSEVPQSSVILHKLIYTVEPPITDPPTSRQPLYNGHWLWHQ